MKYAYIMPNDFVNGTNVSVSVWMQGCPFRCPGCHNQDLWDFNGGKEIDDELFFNNLESMLQANGIKRNLSILGGEPLCKENLGYTTILISWFKEHHPNEKVYLWTGNVFESMSEVQKAAARLCDVVIDGPFVLSQRDISLELRGSPNQRILKKGVDY